MCEREGGRGGGRECRRESERERERKGKRFRAPSFVRRSSPSELKSSLQMGTYSILREGMVCVCVCERERVCVCV